VILDSDLAGLYGVTTARFNEQVRRNAERFPSDFTFQLTQDEFKSLRSQIAILDTGRGADGAPGKPEETHRIPIGRDLES
jgi:ORF6N domain